MTKTMQESNTTLKMSDLTEWFDEAQEISDKTFSIIEQQLATIEEFIGRDDEDRKEINSA